jgi:hypothetical protein
LTEKQQPAEDRLELELKQLLLRIEQEPISDELRSLAKQLQAQLDARMKKDRSET